MTMMDAPSNPATKRALPMAASAFGLSKWRVALAAFVVALAALLAIFSDTVAATVSTWLYSETFNHGFLIPTIAVYLAWRRRHELAAIEPRFDPLGLILVGVATAVSLAGAISATTIIQQIGLVLLIQSLVLCVFGRQVAWLLMFPLLYLFFAVPFGEEFVPHLQDITAFFVVFFLRHIGIPVFIDGVFISTPAGNYLVAEACSGLRYLISTIALGAIFAHLAFHSWWRRTIFVGLSLTVPIVANGIRAFLIVYIAYVSDNRIATGIDHIIYGWIFFSFVTFLLLGLGFAMRDNVAEAPPPVPAARKAGSALGPALGAVIVVATAFAASAYADWISRPPETGFAALAWPTVPGFSKVEAAQATWQPRFAGVDKHLKQVYRGAGRDIDVDVGLYTHERPGAKAITSAHDFSDGDTWKVGDAGLRQIQIGGRPITVRSMRLTAAGKYRVVWYWYWAGGDFAGSPYRAKWLQTKALLTGDGAAVAVIAVSTEYPTTAAEPVDALRSFVAALPDMRATLQRAIRN